MFDMLGNETDAPKMFLIAPELVKERLTRQVDDLAKITARLEPGLGSASLSEKERTQLVDELQHLRLKAEGIAAMREALVEDEEYLVSAAGWRAFWGDTQGYDIEKCVAASLERVKSVEILVAQRDD